MYNSTISNRANRSPLIPDQIARKSLTDKPILRWSERWGDSVLKNPVDIQTGQVSFSLPLVDISESTGWHVQLSLFYNSASKTTDLVGLGWSLPVANDYIAVDYQGSIFDQDARYFLVVQGIPQPIEFISQDGGVQYFSLSNQRDNKLKTTISYNTLNQVWTINGPTEEIIYGRAKHDQAQDALQFTLAWPNWRGVGTSKNKQEPLITRWYLNNRFDKQSKKSLYYYYDKEDSSISNGKNYTSGIRLKSISDGQATRLVLDYIAKPAEEYTKSNPIDEKGNVIFPVPLESSHYLSGYTISTDDYQQTLNFTYKTENGNRLLSDIDQKILSKKESLLRFTYQNFSDHQVLKSCNLPSGSTVDFSYETITIPTLSDLKEVYPIRETPKIAYGLDYAVLGYRNLDPKTGKIFIRIMNREMNKVILDCGLDIKVVCPSVESEIKDYGIQPYENSFVVTIATDEQRILHIYNRYNDTWSLENPIHSFSKDALIRFSSTTIVVAEPDTGNLKILERSNNESNWKEVWNETRPYKITRLALHNKLLAVYDDHELFIFYKDSSSGWKNTVLRSDLTKKLDLKKFDLDSKFEENISYVYNQNGLQVLNNFILLTSLQENNGQLSSHIDLFLLNKKHRIAQSSSFDIKKENLYNLNYEFKDDDSVYKISYIKENNSFKAKVKSISGKICKDIDPIGNKNLREDAMHEMIEGINKDKNFQELFKKNLFINHNLYFSYITPEGAQVGDDTLLRITGTGFEKEPLPILERIPLGSHFILESTNDGKSLYKLYNKKVLNGRTKEKKLQLHEPGQIINKYPAYIAYQSKENFVEVITFKDEKTLGDTHTFSNEQLLIKESDFQNLITVANASSTSLEHAESKKCHIRPIFTLLNPKTQSFVNQMILTSNDGNRTMACKRSFNKEPNSLSLSEKIKIIPGNNKTSYGWHEINKSYQKSTTQTTQSWFNNDGTEVFTPPEEQSDKKYANETNTKSNQTLLLDRSGNFQISDFFPYSLADEMGAYHGFESYENNQIGISNTTSIKSWEFNEKKYS